MTEGSENEDPLNNTDGPTPEEIRQARNQAAARRTFAVLQYVGLSLAVGLVLLARTTYYDGYAAALGIPADLAFESRLSVADLIGWVLGTMLALNAAFLVSYLLMKRRGPVTLIGALVFCGGLAMSWNSDATRIATGALVMAVAAIPLFAIWLYPLIRYRSENGLRARLRKADEALVVRKVPAVPLDEPIDLTSVLLRLGGWPAVTILALVIAVPTASFVVGKYVTRARLAWTTIQTNELPNDPNQSWVVLGWHGEKLLVAPVQHTDRVVQPKFRYVAVSASTRLVPGVLGRLSAANSE